MNKEKIAIQIIRIILIGAKQPYKNQSYQNENRLDLTKYQMQAM